jgi:hypothetical protein
LPSRRRCRRRSGCRRHLRWPPGNSRAACPWTAHAAPPWRATTFPYTKTPTRHTAAGGLAVRCPIRAGYRERLRSWSTPQNAPSAHECLDGTQGRGGHIHLLQAVQEPPRRLPAVCIASLSEAQCRKQVSRHGTSAKHGVGVGRLLRAAGARALRRGTPSRQRRLAERWPLARSVSMD